MPLYLYGCCGQEIELLRDFNYSPVCDKCGSKMEKLPTSPSIVRILGKNGERTYSKGYKEGYAKDWQKDVPPFEPKS